jgi:hypothetical protein
VSDAAARIAELARGRHVHQGGLDGNRHQLAALDLPPFASRPLPAIEKISGAPLVQDVEERPGCHQDDHHDDEGWHEGGRYECGKRGKRIAGEHRSPFLLR